MEKIFKDNRDGTLTVTASYTQEEYVPVLNKVARHLAENVEIKGFRKGKAPLDRAMAYIKNEDMYDGMVKKLINRDFPTLLDGYEEAMNVANIQPSLNVDYDEKLKVYSFIYSFVFLPKAEISKYTGFNIASEVKEVTAEEIDAKIADLRKDQAELAPSEDASKMGDTVNIDFTGFIDNKPFDGGSAKSYDLVLGSNSFIPGFEQELVGLKEGEHKSFLITFPENYVAALAGKEARFEVVVNSVKVQLLPEADDEFAKSVAKYDAETMEDLKTKISAEIKETHETEARSHKLEEILTAVEKESTFTIAERYLSANADSINKQKLEQIKQYGLDEKEYLQLVGMTHEQFVEEAKKTAEKDAKVFAIFRAVSADEKIELSDDDVAQAFGGKEKYAEILAAIAKDGEQEQNNRYLEQVKSNILNHKIEEFLITHN